MNQMIFKTTYIAMVLLFFVACSDEAYFKNSPNSINIDSTCLADPTTDDISNYTPLQSGDVILRDAKDSVISTYHDIDGNKTVCMVRGKAYIIRKLED